MAESFELAIENALRFGRDLGLAGKPGEEAAIKELKRLPPCDAGDLTDRATREEQAAKVLKRLPDKRTRNWIANSAN